MTKMTPAETLRAAAQRLREMGNRATPAPWMWTGYAVDVVPTTRGTYVAESNDNFDIDEFDGAWMAMMSPAVAEPLAQILDQCAALIDQWPDPSLGRISAEKAACHVIEFACVILGEQPAVTP